MINLYCKIFFKSMSICLRGTKYETFPKHIAFHVVVLAPHDSNVVVYVQVIAIIIPSPLKFIDSFKVAELSFTCFLFRPGTLVCFLESVPLLAFPILLHQLQENKRILSPL